MVGQVLRIVSGRRVLLFPEEKPDFIIPERYRPKEKRRQSEGVPRNTSEPQRQAAQDSNVTVVDEDPSPNHDDQDEEDPNIVTWYGPDDAENPQNW